MKALIPRTEYDSLVTADNDIPLRDIFPHGITFEVYGDSIELLTPPDSRYKVIDGVVVRVDQKPSQAEG